MPARDDPAGVERPGLGADQDDHRHRRGSGVLRLLRGPAGGALQEARARRAHQHGAVGLGHGVLPHQRPDRVRLRLGDRRREQPQPGSQRGGGRPGHAPGALDRRRRPQHRQPGSAQGQEGRRGPRLGRRGVLARDDRQAQAQRGGLHGGQRGGAGDGGGARARQHRRLRRVGAVGDPRPGRRQEHQGAQGPGRHSRAGRVHLHEPRAGSGRIRSRPTGSCAPWWRRRTSSTRTASAPPRTCPISSRAWIRRWSSSS